jgi:hypothetical protein
MIDFREPDDAGDTKPKRKRKPKPEPAPAKDGAFAQARKIFWADPKQDRATFLAACAAVGMNPKTAVTRFYCLSTGRDASCANESLRGV